MTRRSTGRDRPPPTDPLAELDAMLQTMVDDTFAAVGGHRPDVETLCRAAAVSPDWLRDRLAAGLLAPAAPGEVAWVKRVRCMRRVELDFGAGPELAALVADLGDEIARLRRRLHRLGVED
jgi:chaperone modulatory protein CbpM